MRKPHFILFGVLALVLILGSPASAGETASGGIQWFATWEQAAAEAKRTQRPILLISAAPHCRNISGMW